MLQLIESNTASNTEFLVLIKELEYGKLILLDAAKDAYVFIPDAKFNEAKSPVLLGIAEAKSHLIKFYCHIQSLKKTHMNYNRI